MKLLIVVIILLSLLLFVRMEWVVDPMWTGIPIPPDVDRTGSIFTALASVSENDTITVYPITDEFHADRLTEICTGCSNASIRVNPITGYTYFMPPDAIHTFKTDNVTLLTWDHHQITLVPIDDTHHQVFDITANGAIIDIRFDRVALCFHERNRTYELINDLRAWDTRFLLQDEEESEIVKHIGQDEYYHERNRTEGIVFTLQNVAVYNITPAIYTYDVPMHITLDNVSFPHVSTPIILYNNTFARGATMNCVNITTPPITVHEIRDWEIPLNVLQMEGTGCIRTDYVLQHTLYYNNRSHVNNTGSCVDEVLYDSRWMITVAAIVLITIAVAFVIIVIVFLFVLIYNMCRECARHRDNEQKGIVPYTPVEETVDLDEMARKFAELRKDVNDMKERRGEIKNRPKKKKKQRLNIN